MQSLWNDEEAKQYKQDPIQFRVYTSRLLGKEPSLVLHGGGNTSVKIREKNLFGDWEHLLYVKGSGWDLATIEAQGFAPVKMDTLLQMARLDQLSDTDMVRVQKSAMTNPNAPSPSVEAILHAIIPFDYVDHTHADAVVAITNTLDGKETIKKIYGNRLLYIPYVMPGFILAKKVYELTRDIDWKKYEGMILLHHGIFSFGDDARTSYERMIHLVNEAETYIFERAHPRISSFNNLSSITQEPNKESLLKLATLRRAVSKEKGCALIAKLNSSAEALGFLNLRNVSSIIQRGPLTPDHVLHTKRFPLVVSDGPDFIHTIEDAISNYAKEYSAYFDRNKSPSLNCLDAAPRWVVWLGVGTVAFGQSSKKADVVADISKHTMRAIQWAENLGGWRALPEKDIFDVEYWELEQAKLKKSGNTTAPLQGKIALVTGAASGIGKATVETLKSQGAAVMALDLNPKVTELFNTADVMGYICDVTDSKAVDAAISATVRQFGGLDILITNAGTFPASKNIAELTDEAWKQTIEINLSSHHYVMRACIPYLNLGMDPAIVVIASKNVPAPGPGAAAYSAAKAGLTQLARVAALELGPKGIRVNILHPNAVFDTAIWSTEVLKNRAAHYQMSVEEYKIRNILHTEVSSKDVALLACAMAGPLFSKTTGSQIPVDGGNDRVI